MMRALKFSVLGVAAAALLVVTAMAFAPAHANPRYGAIVVDLQTHDVLYEDEADARRFPASLTKMMTLYMLFEAIERGDVRMNEALPVSRAASRQPPSRLGLRRGQSITVDDAIRALAARSANDVATVVAERLAGTESQFAAVMTSRARQLGMASTRFANASGLPDDRHATTARDMAVLSEALMRDFPQHYHYFSLDGMTWRGRHGRNHNRLLGSVEGVDGIKTGYTRASRYNLASSALRNDRRIIVVVLGGESSAARNAEVEHLIEYGFEELRRREIEGGGAITMASRYNAQQWTEDDAEAQGDESEVGDDAFSPALVGDGLAAPARLPNITGAAVID